MSMSVAGQNDRATRFVGMADLPYLRVCQVITGGRLVIVVATQSVSILTV
jgi:hypothetical protein